MELAFSQNFAQISLDAPKPLWNQCFFQFFLLQHVLDCNLAHLMPIYLLNQFVKPLQLSQPFFSAEHAQLFRLIVICVQVWQMFCGSSTVMSESNHHPRAMAHFWWGRVVGGLRYGQMWPCQWQHWLLSQTSADAVSSLPVRSMTGMGSGANICSKTFIWAYDIDE